MTLILRGGMTVGINDIAHFVVAQINGRIFGIEREMPELANQYFDIKYSDFTAQMYKVDILIFGLRNTKISVS